MNMRRRVITTPRIGGSIANCPIGTNTRRRVDSRVGGRCSLARTALDSGDVVRCIRIARGCDRELGAILASRVQPLDRLLAHVPGELGFLLQRDCRDHIDEEQTLEVIL